MFDAAPRVTHRATVPVNVISSALRAAPQTAKIPTQANSTDVLIVIVLFSSKNHNPLIPLIDPSRDTPGASGEERPMFSELRDPLDMAHRAVEDGCDELYGGFTKYIKR